MFVLQYPTRSRVQRITMPTLFLSGLADSLIPPSMMQQLYDVSMMQQLYDVSMMQQLYDISMMQQLYDVSNVRECEWSCRS